MSEIVERFSRIRRDRPDRPLLHVPASGVSLTAQAIWDAHHRQRSLLEAAGIGHEHLLVCAAGNHPAVPPLWLACRSLGIAVLPVDASTPTVEIAQLARRFGATAAILPSHVDRTAAIGEPTPFAEGQSLIRVSGSEPAPHLYTGAAALKLTSGSTGLPKATFTTESQLVRDSTHIVEAMGISPRDCQLAAIPISHAYGLGNLVMPLLLQGTAVVLREGFVPHQFERDAAAYEVRIFPGVPFMFDHFVAHLPHGAWPRTVDTLISAGARLETATVHAFHRSFGVKIHSFYGTSETGGIAFDESRELAPETTVGRALPGVRITLRPEDGAPDEGGRVHVAGNAVASGYVGEGPADEGFTGDGFLTGDFGRFDSTGRLMLTGRASSFINVAGRKVQPEEVEQVLRAMPDVADVRVLGGPDATRGQQIVACIVPRGAPPSVLSVREFCAPRLAAYKIPRAVLNLDRIPLTERGKTNRAALDALVREHLDRTARERML